MSNRLAAGNVPATLGQKDPAPGHRLPAAADCSSGCGSVEGSTAVGLLGELFMSLIFLSSI